MEDQDSRPEHTCIDKFLDSVNRSWNVQARFRHRAALHQDSGDVQEDASNLCPVQAHFFATRSGRNEAILKYRLFDKLAWLTSFVAKLIV